MHPPAMHANAVGLVGIAGAGIGRSAAASLYRASPGNIPPWKMPPWGVASRHVGGAAVTAVLPPCWALGPGAGGCGRGCTACLLVQDGRGSGSSLQGQHSREEVSSQQWVAVADTRDAAYNPPWPSPPHPPPPYLSPGLLPLCFPLPSLPDSQSILNASPLSQRTSFLPPLSTSSPPSMQPLPTCPARLRE